MSHIRRRATRGAIVVFTALGLLVAIVSVTPLVLWYAQLLAGQWDDPKGDVLVVLGGSEIGDALMGPESYWRAVYGIWAYKDGFRNVIVSGNGISGLMMAFLVSSGVPESAIEREDRSRSTRENALYSAYMLRYRPGRKVLLTSDYHMFRAHRAFRKAGIQISPRPVPDAIKRSSGWRGRWPAFLDEAVETAKIIYYCVRGWI